MSFLKFSRITLKAPVLGRSSKLSSNEPVQYLDGLPIKNHQLR